MAPTSPRHSIGHFHPTRSPQIRSTSPATAAAVRHKVPRLSQQQPVGEHVDDVTLTPIYFLPVRSQMNVLIFTAHQ